MQIIYSYNGYFTLSLSEMCMGPVPKMASALHSLKAANPEGKVRSFSCLKALESTV